ncbi:hypothetical protein N7497_000653 [Penicillium chrysogenum]|nr:hypothetical protein N7497_000653 [Penicillium chrysogenum]
MAVRKRPEARRRYHWPELQLNIWIMVVLSCSATCLGIFSWFIVVQSQMHLGTPWLFPYMVVCSALGVCFIFLIMVLASRHFLLPGIIIIGSFILLVLWLTGLIETSLQLYGVVANSTICNCWKTAFALELVNTVFYLWMMIMSWQVNRDVY